MGFNYGYEKKKLNCPTWQKIKLIDAIIEDAKKEAKAKVEK